MRLPVGIDEVGRGPVAGPLCVCALRITNRSSFYSVRNVRDSKRLSAANREAVAKTLSKEKRQGKVFYAVAYVSSAYIDSLGMSRALRTAVAKVLKKMSVGLSNPIILDGSLSAPHIYTNQKTIIKGDEKEKVIALASIVAKVSRDKRMRSYSKKWPYYSFEKNKGYGTREHYRAIEEYGLTAIHRQTFLKNAKVGKNRGPLE
jgi:ribonuclease HII